MTREEAITLMKSAQLMLVNPTTNEPISDLYEALDMAIEALEQEPIGHCKDCKHFEYDSVANVDGVPLIVAHEICNKWGNGCKTKENGYCFLFEPQESEET